MTVQLVEVVCLDRVCCCGRFEGPALGRVEHLVAVEIAHRRAGHAAGTRHDDRSAAEVDHRLVDIVAAAAEVARN